MYTDNSDQFSLLYKALMTGVFVGFSDSIICLFFNIFYRGSTDYIPADIINVSSIIFGVNSLFIIIGMIYYFFLKTMKRGEFLYMALFVLISLFCLWKVEGVNRSDVSLASAQFRGLLMGLTLIVGISATFIMPLLFHNKWFERDVL